ncbi:hypothetical protein [Streptomyces sp. NPDC004284]
MSVKARIAVACAAAVAAFGFAAGAVVFQSSGDTLVLAGNVSNCP